MKVSDLLWSPVVMATNTLQNVFVKHQNIYKLLLINGLESFRWNISKHRAAAVARKAKRQVPAYNDFYKAVPANRLQASTFNLVPVTDKEVYVKHYKIEQRCWNGVLPTRGVTVDESSGSTGSPTNWVRGWDERQITKELLQLSFYATFGKQPLFVFNAFVLGAWATGMIVSQSLGEICVMKSTGSDAQKILSTMEYFGKGYHYVIMGYPPFLKSLIDDHNFDWSGYSVAAIYGGEAITEQLRDYLGKTFNKVIGSYGASDLEINIGYENPLTIAIRKAILADEKVRKELARDFGSLPSVFQYNPLAYYIETNEQNELLFTINRPSSITPKIRYNIHDIGYVLRYQDVVAALERAGRLDILRTLSDQRQRTLNLPFLFHYGRSDMSVTYFGAKVTPEGIRQSLYAISDISQSIESFQAYNAENTQKDVLLVVCVELISGADKASYDAATISKYFAAELGALNGDFAKMYSTAEDRLKPEVRLYEHQTGPFTDGHKKIKHSYVATLIQYDDLPV